MEISDFKTEGFFELSEEQKTIHLNYVYNIFKESYETDTRNRLQYHKYMDHIIHLDELEEYFSKEEDYEMCYIIEKIRERFKHNYGN